MTRKIADLELKLDVNALHKMSVKRLKELFPTVLGMNPEELGEVVKRMISSLKRHPVGLYSIKIEDFGNKYIFSLGVGYLDDYIYPEFFGYYRETKEIKYF